MLLALLIANVVLLATALGAPVRHARRSPPFKRAIADPLGYYVESARRRPPVDLTGAIYNALRGNGSVAAEALRMLASDPQRSVAALPSIMSLIRENSSSIRFSAAAAARVVLSARPDVADFTWPDASPYARCVIVASLRLHDDRTRKQPNGSSVHGRILKDALRDGDVAVRAVACARLSLVARGEALALATAAVDDPDEEVSRLACGLLGRLGTSETIEFLVERLARGDARRSPALLRALGEVGRRHFDALRAMASTGAPLDRAAAIQGLGATGVESVTAIVAPMIEDRTKEVRRAAASAVANIARVSGMRTRFNPATELIVRQLGQERSPSVMLALLDAVEACDLVEAHPAVLRELPQMNPAVRERALEVLATIQPHG